MKYFYTFIISTLVSFASFAQVTETFESFTTGCSNSFTTNSITFGANKLRIFVPGQCTSINVNGLGVGNACTGDGCASVSDKFFDNGGNYATLQTYVISTAGVDFNLKSMYVYISTDGGNTATSGSVTFVGKRAGATIFTFTKTVWPNSSNGFSYLNFVTEGGTDNSNKNIDAIEMTTAGTINYIAVDNFRFSLPAQVSYTSTTVPPGLYNATPSANANNRVVLADFNNDGHIDMLSQFGGNGTAVTYHQNNGNGTFASVLGTNTNPSTITSGVLSGLDFIDLITSKYYVYDFDNDGDNDIYESNSASECRYMRSNGSSFTLITMPTGLPTTVSPAFGRFVPRDYDNDGDIDVLYQLGTGVTGINVAINNGSGSFTVTAANASGTFTSGIFNGVNMSNVISIGMQNVDVDNDGDIDILQVQNGNTNFYRNNGNNWSNAALPSGLPLTTAGSRFLPADFDADGDIDVLFQPTNTASVGIVLALNNGSGAFTNISASGVGTFSSGPFSGLTFIDIFQTLIYPADYDSDGDVDLYILPNAVAGSINYYKNGGTAPTLSSRLPLNSATGVSLTPTLSLTFNEAVFAGTSNNNIYIKRFSDDVTVATVASNSASVTGSGSTTITVSVSGLVGGTQYYVAFDDQAFKDNEGVIWGAYNFQTRERNGYRNKSFWSFTTFAACSNPVVVTQPTNSTICGAANTSFSLSATGATSYQWQLNTGTGFNNLVNGGVYSNATTSTLGITAAIAGMNNYQYRCIATNGACNTTSTGAILRISVPNVSIASFTNVSCNGGSNGSIVANVPTGGVGPYSYNWTPGTPTGDGTATITGLIANTWTINITDAIGCTTVASATVTQPSAINSGSTLFTHITNCGLTNGVATLTGSGGLGTLEYSTNGTNWFTTTVFSGLASGSYTPRVRSQAVPSCSVSGTLFTITTPSAPSISSVVDSDITNCGLTNGRATITGTGGTGTLEYSINNSNWFTNNVFTGLGANTYTSYIRNQGSTACSATGTSFTITTPSAPSISSVLDNDISNCGLTNGTVTITGTGGTGTLEYSINNTAWFTTNIFTGLSANTYSTYIRNQNSTACSATGASFTITTPGTPSISSVVDSDISNCGITDGRATITGTGGTGTLEYSINNSNWFTSNVFTNIGAATYTTYIRNQSSIACSATGASFTITAPGSPSISLVVDSDIINCGLTNGSVTITGSGGVGTLEYSINGSSWFTTTIFSNLTANTYATYVRNQSTPACSATGASFTITTPSAPSISNVLDSDISNCGLTNGSATITGTGGTGTLEYSINNSSWFTSNVFAGLNATTYPTYIRNQNSTTCSASGASFTITTPSAPSISSVVDSDITSCGITDGRATISGTGGTGTLEYSINNSNWFTSNVFTNIGAATYTTYIRNQSSIACSATGASFTITAPGSPSISSIVDNDIINCGLTNGSVTITGAGGVGTLEYSINGSSWFTTTIFSNLTANTYATYVRNQSTPACSATGASFTITTPSAPSISNVLDSDISNCGLTNGSATITGTGGTGTLEYSINNSTWFTSNVFVGLSATTYSTYIRNQNSTSCSATGASFTITTPSAPSISSVVDSDISNCGLTNGRATITGIGGTGTLEYSIDNSSWSTSNVFTGLTATTYSTYIRNQNSIACSATGASFTITIPSSPTISSTNYSDVTNCTSPNGSVTITGSGGTGTLEYSIDNSTWTTSTVINGLSATTYIPYIRNQNSIACSVSGTTFTPISFPTTIVSQPQSTSICSGGSPAQFTVTATGSAPFSYAWSNGLSVTNTMNTNIAGTYTVTVTGGCGTVISSGATLSVVTSTSINTQPANQTICGGTFATISIDGIGVGLSYLWNTGETTTSISKSVAGTYLVTLTGNCGIAVSNQATLQVDAITQITSAPTSQVVCPNASATLGVTATGTGILSYLWNTNATAASISTSTVASDYQVTVTGRCGIAISNQVAVSNAVSTQILSQMPNQTLCGGNTNILTISADGTNLAYIWNTGATTSSIGTNLSGNYAVTVSGACGMVSTTIELTLNQATAIVTQPLSQSLINGTANLTVSAIGTNLNYEWNTGETTTSIVATTTGSYTVTVSGLCGTSISNAASITNPITAISTATVLGISTNGNILTITSPVLITINGTGFTNATNVTINGVSVPVVATIGTNVLLVQLPVGVITSTSAVIQVQNPNQLASANTPVVITDATLSTNLPTYQSTNFSIYPNPVTNGEWRIENGVLGATIYVFNAQGAIVYTQTITSTSTEVATKLSSGIYLVKVGTQMVKLVVE